MRKLHDINNITNDIAMSTHKLLQGWRPIGAPCYKHAQCACERSFCKLAIARTCLREQQHGGHQMPCICIRLENEVVNIVNLAPLGRPVLQNHKYYLD